MILKQLLDKETSTYTYILADEATREAIIIDSVIENIDRDMRLIFELDLQLLYAIETHVHADHITGAGKLRKLLGCQTIANETMGIVGADLTISDGDKIKFGRYELEARNTPGHTSGCTTYVLQNGSQTFAFTGDTLLIRGCGRTDFQQGCATTLYNSIQNQIFTLPENTIIYPGHDYKGHISTTVEEERAHNPRIKDAISEKVFVEIMNNLNLSEPQKIHTAVPANLQGGLSTVQDIEPEHVCLSDFHLIDVRELTEYQQGHIQNTELLPLSRIQELDGTVEHSTKILLICRSGRRSRKAGDILCDIGYQNVYNLKGGMMAWNELRGGA